MAQALGGPHAAASLRAGSFEHKSMINRVTEPCVPIKTLMLFGYEVVESGASSEWLIKLLPENPTRCLEFPFFRN